MSFTSLISEYETSKPADWYTSSRTLSGKFGMFTFGASYSNLPYDGAVAEESIAREGRVSFALKSSSSDVS